MKLFSPQITYLDNASWMPITKKAYQTVKQSLAASLANSSSIHDLGQKSKKIVDESRLVISKTIGAHTDEVFFVGSGTESIALAIEGTIYAATDVPLPHIVTSTIEHSAVLETCRLLEKRKHAVVTYISPSDYTGVVSVQDIKNAIKDSTVLVSIHAVNAEIGVRQPIEDYIKMLNKIKEERYSLQSIRLSSKPYYPYLHVDACQAYAHMDCSTLVRKGIDLISFNSSKIGGPAGIAALYKRRWAYVMPMYAGGDQEKGLRPGTTPHFLCAGFSAAAKENSKMREHNEEKYVNLKKELMIGLTKFGNKKELFFIENSNVNSIPSIINISFPFFSGQQMAIELNARNIAVSSKSACKSETEDESYVVQEIRKKDILSTYTVQGSIRVSFGPASTKEDIHKLLVALQDIAETYRGVLY